jgi:hypothetical protein
LWVAASAATTIAKKNGALAPEASRALSLLVLMR